MASAYIEIEVHGVRQLEDESCLVKTVTMTPSSPSDPEWTMTVETWRYPNSDTVVKQNAHLHVHRFPDGPDLTLGTLT